MGKLTEKDVKYVAKLAQIKLSKEEVEKYKKQLSNVILYVEELNEVDTSGVKPTSQTTGLKNMVRKDVIKIGECLNQEEALSGTETVDNGYFVVPVIFKKRFDE
jgi:aspartyl-tRNA(Asn)/glutamyl-tRNA(Gln) amidotransferase subunit C